MPNFSDPAITQASNIAQQAQANATAQAKNAAAGAVSSATGVVTEAASKAAATVESAVKTATSAVSSVTSAVSGAAASVTSAISNITSAAQNALSSALGGLATGSGTAPFALPTFISNPGASIGVKDVYGVDNNAVANLAEIAGQGQSSQLTSALQSAMGAGGLSDAVSALTQGANGAVGLDPAGLTDRIKEALGGSTAAVSRLGDTALSSAMSGLSGPTGALMSSFGAVINNTATSFSAPSTEGAKGLFDTINNLTNNSQMAQYFDVGAEASLLTGLFQEAVDLKLPSAITVLADNANSTAAANQALKNITVNALNSGDVSTVTMLVDQLGSGPILSIAPQAAAMVLTNYTVPKGTTQGQLATEGTNLINLLNSINAQWDSVDRNGTATSDLTCFTYMSDDARRVLMAEGSYSTEILIAKSYPRQTWLELIGEMYPLSPLVFRLH